MKKIDRVYAAMEKRSDADTATGLEKARRVNVSTSIPLQNKRLPAYQTSDRRKAKQ